jgi:hypothetical protein
MGSPAPFRSGALVWPAAVRAWKENPVAEPAPRCSATRIP